MAAKTLSAKTNASRLLDQLGIAHELLPYEVDEEDLSAAHVAAQLGQPLEQVFKTILLRGEPHGLLVCVVPGNAEVDLKRAAVASGNKRVAPVPLKELQPLTGYVRGGCSPVGMKRAYPTYLDETAILFDWICVSAGLRGLQLRIRPQDLADATHATFAALA